MLHHVIHWGRRCAERPKVKLNQLSRCGVRRVSGRQLLFLLVGNTLDSKLTHGAYLDLDEADRRTHIGLKIWW